jgi:CheY-like chemotaxis protein
MADSCVHFILVVDDDADFRSAITTVLEDEGYSVLTAVDGQDALKRLRHGARPCVIILDLMMPIMDGPAFLDAQQASSELATIPVVVMSAHLKKMLQEELPPGVEYLRKPAALALLLGAIERQCASAAGLAAGR